MEVIISIIVGISLLFPILHVLLSNRSHGGATFGWFLAVICFSWLGWIVFLIVTQNESDRRRGI